MPTCLNPAVYPDNVVLLLAGTLLTESQQFPETSYALAVLETLLGLALSWSQHFDQDFLLVTLSSPQHFDDVPGLDYPRF